MENIKCINVPRHLGYIFFFFNDTAPTEIYTLPLRDALPIYGLAQALGQALRDDARGRVGGAAGREGHGQLDQLVGPLALGPGGGGQRGDGGGAGGGKDLAARGLEGGGSHMSPQAGRGGSESRGAVWAGTSARSQMMFLARSAARACSSRPRRCCSTSSVCSPWCGGGRRTGRRWPSSA